MNVKIKGSQEIYKAAKKVRKKGGKARKGGKFKDNKGKRRYCQGISSKYGKDREESTVRKCIHRAKTEATARN